MYRTPRLQQKLRRHAATVCVIGLGYVGLPLANAFARSLKVIGFDTDARKVGKLSSQQSRTPAAQANLSFTTDPAELSKADFAIICVSTPVTPSKEPDLTYVTSAAEVVGRNMNKGCVVVLESTVCPGVTEDVLKPILEEQSGLQCGEDFKVAYSPERINPGDDEHSVETITKVVSGMDAETTELVADLYREITLNIFKAKDIKTAEAAKVIENIQRDLNIALANELSLIFEKMGLSTRDVLEAAATKWNFHRYSPGLVGGHCIPVAPYYLVHKAKELGYHPQVMLAGRATNDFMPRHIAEMTVKALNSVGKVTKGSKVLIMGLTYKEDIPDIRETPARDVIRELKEYEVEVYGFDPLLSAGDLQGLLDVRLLRNIEEVRQTKVDAIILAVVHTSFRKLGLPDLKGLQNSNPILIDVRGAFGAADAEKAGFCYRSL